MHIAELADATGTDDILSAAETVAYLLSSEVLPHTPIAAFQRCARAWMMANNASPIAAVNHYAGDYAWHWKKANGDVDASLDSFLAAYRVN